MFFTYISFSIAAHPPAVVRQDIGHGGQHSSEDSGAEEAGAGERGEQAVNAETA